MNTDLKLTLKRVKLLREGILGHLYLHPMDEDVTQTFLLRFNTLEPPDIGLRRGANLALPSGEYQVEITKSATAGNKDGLLPLIFSDTVPKDRRILIHAGNTLSDTKGCILLGRYDEGLVLEEIVRVELSRHSMGELMDLLPPSIGLTIE